MGYSLRKTFMSSKTAAYIVMGTFIPTRYRDMHVFATTQLSTHILGFSNVLRPDG